MAKSSEDSQFVWKKTNYVKRPFIDICNRFDEKVIKFENILTSEKSYFNDNSAVKETTLAKLWLLGESIYLPIKSKSSDRGLIHVKEVGTNPTPICPY